MIYLDASSISTYLACPEKFRRTYVENQIPHDVALDQAFGGAIHSGVEAFWNGKPFEHALTISVKEFTGIDQSRIGDRKKYSRLADSLADLLACYYDSVEYDPDVLLWSMEGPPREFVEYEFSIQPFGLEDVLLVGRIDRAEKKRLVDVKTASEIDGYENGKKIPWKENYRQMMLRDYGLKLYDWYLCQIGYVPAEIVLEVLLKPNERYGKKCRIEYLEMNELIPQREEFKQQLEWACRDIRHLVMNYRDTRPWLKSAYGGACEGKYSPCGFRSSCNGFRQKMAVRQEHLTQIQGKRV